MPDARDHPCGTGWTLLHYLMHRGVRMLTWPPSKAYSPGASDRGGPGTTAGPPHSLSATSLFGLVNRVVLRLRRMVPGITIPPRIQSGDRKWRSYDQDDGTGKPWPRRCGGYQLSCRGYHASGRTAARITLRSRRPLPPSLVIVVPATRFPERPSARSVTRKASGLGTVAPDAMGRRRLPTGSASTRHLLGPDRLRLFRPRPRGPIGR